MKQRQSARLVKASDVIVDGIRDRILHERLPVGSPLPSEADLMEDYGLGRVTVRESLRLLERDGIVSIRRGPGGGVFVGTPDIQRLSEVFTVLMAIRDVTLRDLLEFRKVIEPPAARCISSSPKPRTMPSWRWPSMPCPTTLRTTRPSR